MSALSADYKSIMSPGHEEIFEILRMREDLFVYFLISVVTDETFGGIKVIPDPDGGRFAFVVQKVPGVQALREQAIPFTSPDLVRAFSQSIGSYVLHGYLDLVTPCVFNTAWSLSSPTRLLPGLFWWRGGGVESQKSGRKKLFCPWENDNKLMVAARDGSLASAHFVYSHDGQLELLGRLVKRSCGGITTNQFRANSIKQPLAIQDLSDQIVPWQDRQDQGLFLWGEEIGGNNDFVAKTFKALYQSAHLKSVIGFGEVPSTFEDFVTSPTESRRTHLAQSKVLILGERNFDHRLYVAEACALGVPVVAPRLRWAQALFPESYPLLYTPFDIDDAVEKAELALHPGQSFSEELPGWAKEVFGSTPLVDHVVELNRSESAVVADPSSVAGSKFVARAKSLLSGKDTFKFSWFLGEARKGGIAKGFRGRSQADSGEWYAILAELGYVDGGGPDPVMAKE